MITRSGNQGFLAAHYDWIVAGVGVLALLGAGAFYAMTLGSDPDGAASEATRSVERMRPSETGVKNVDMSPFQAAMRVTRNPALVAEISEKMESFLSSERRVSCKKCKKAISGDVRKVPACPFCGEKQEVEKKVVLDADSDGLPTSGSVASASIPGTLPMLRPTRTATASPTWRSSRPKPILPTARTIRTISIRSRSFCR